jgi:uncharacterized protein
MSEAYLDIETTGLSPLRAEMTVIGVYLVSGRRNRLVQLVGEQITGGSLLETLRGVNAIYTYNGSRFDLPFINASLGVNLTEAFPHHDLMFDCWRCRLKGGLKAVEQQLGISREVQGVNGWEAVILWWRYRNDGDQGALDLLLRYNRDDVVNLKVLRERLQCYP